MTSRRQFILALAALPVAKAIGALPTSVDLSINGEKGTYDLRTTKPTTLPSTQPGTGVVDVPPVVTVPTLPALIRSGQVKLNKAKPSLLSTVIDGGEQNIYGTGPAPLFLTEVFSTRPRSQTWNYGQVTYFDSTNTVTIAGCYFRGSWNELPPEEQTAYRHCLYRDFGGELTIVRDSWISSAAACLLQSRGPALYINCFLEDGAVGICQVYGNARAEDVVVYGGHHYYQPPSKGRDGKPQPAAWTSNAGIVLYAPLACKNVQIVGKPGQGENNNLLPGIKQFNIGAVVGSSSYGKEQWKPAKDAAGNRITNLLTDEGGNGIYGWPGPNVAGDLPPSLKGWTIKAEPVDAIAEVNAIRAKMEARQISVKEAVEAAKAAVRAKVGK